GFPVIVVFQLQTLQQETNSFRRDGIQIEERMFISKEKREQFLEILYRPNRKNGEIEMAVKSSGPGVDFRSAGEISLRDQAQAILFHFKRIQSTGLLCTT